MYNKILLATDGSKTSLKAAKTANDFIKNGIAKRVTVIHVVNTTLAVHYNLDFNSCVYQHMYEELQENGQIVVERTKNLFDSGVEVEGVVKFGDSAASVCELARDGYELIIVGSRGMNPLSNVVLGSVSNRIIHYAPCPVLIVKPD